MHWWIIGGVTWFGLGLLDAGLIYAANQRGYPILCRETVKRDRVMALISFISGPIALWVTWSVYGFKHGWLAPWKTCPKANAEYDQWHKELAELEAIIAEFQANQKIVIASNPKVIH